MKVGVVSDIHSNIVALKSVLEDMPKVDKKICCGDIVGYNDSPSQCVDLVRDEFDIVVQGNHDRIVSEKEIDDIRAPGRILSKKLLDNEQLNWLSELPDKKKYENLLITHSHPKRQDKYVYPREFPRLNKYISDGEILLMGHTHIMHTYKKDNKLILNPGSVGQPRDGNVFSSYLIVDTNKFEVDVKRTEYDLNKVKKRILEAGLPRDNYRRLFEGK
jgi:putative phosphoesterase